MLGEEEENMKDGMLKGVGQHPPSTDRRRQPRNQRARAREHSNSGPDLGGKFTNQAMHRLRALLTSPTASFG